MLTLARMNDETQPAPRGVSGGDVQLTVVTTHGARSLSLPRGSRVTIGRSRAADVTIDDTSLSRIHAALELREPISLTDLGSANGSKVRGEPVPPHVPVTVGPGELVELGAVLVIVQGAGAALSQEASVRIDLTGHPSTMDAVRETARKAALHRLNVLILGETGVGKGVIAREIHDLSPRADKPFVVVDCAAIARELAESELFGHEAGAFTSARSAKLGLLEVADGGTVLLDEIGELELPLQAKLLRAIEERTIRRVGGVASIRIDTRFLAATNRDLGRDALEGRFRKDLLYRLNAVTLVIPPLRERRAEIVPLAASFLRELGGTAAPRLSPDATRWLRDHDWPGNVRELRNAVERAFAHADGATIEREHLDGGGSSSMPSPAAEGSERERIIATLEQCAGNQTKAAALLGISRRTLIYRLDLFGLPRPRKPSR